MLDKKILTDKYIELAIIHGNTLQNGMHIEANKSYKEIIKVFNLIKKSNEKVDDILLEIMNNENINVQIWAATHSLSSNKNIKESVKKLNEISRRTGIGIVRLSAQMVLENWNKTKKIIL